MNTVKVAYQMKSSMSYGFLLKTAVVEN